MNKDYESIKGVKLLGRTIYFFSDVNEEAVCEAIYLIRTLELESTKKPIELHISSCGGSCYDGLALYDKLRSSECHIITVGSGLVASMGVPIFLAGDERIVTENIRMMNHKTTTGVEGNISDVEVDVREVRFLEENILELMSERTGRSITSLRNETKTTARYLSAEDCVKEGYADTIIINKRTRRRKKKAK